MYINILKKYKSILLVILLLINAYLLSKLVIQGVILHFNTDFGWYYYISKASVIIDRPKFFYSNYVPLFPGLYPPPSLLLFVLFNIFNFTTGKTIFTIVNTILLVLNIYTSLKIFNKKQDLLLFNLLMLSVLLSNSVFQTFSLGQINIILQTIFIFGFYHIAKKREINNYVNTLLISIGVITKISPVIILFYALMKKNIKIVIYTMITLIILAILSELIIYREGAPSINAYFLAKIVPMVSDQTHEAKAFYDQSLLGLIKSTGIDSKLPAILHGSVQYIYSKLISYSIILFLFAFSVYRYYKSNNLDKDILVFNIFVLLAIMGTGLAWYHTMLIIFFPFWGYITYIYRKGGKWNIILLLLLLFLFHYRPAEETLMMRYFHKPMTFGGLILIAFYIRQLFLVSTFEVNEDYEESTTLYNIDLQKYSLVILTIATIIFINPLTLNEKIKEGRDDARIKHLIIISRVLANRGPEYIQGEERNSYTYPENVDKGYIPFEKGQHTKVLNELSILPLDPINNELYNYNFSSDAEAFYLSANLESKKYISEFGAEFDRVYNFKLNKWIVKESRKNEIFATKKVDFDPD